MSSAMNAPAIPQSLAERFATTYADFVNALEIAVQSAPQHPGFSAGAALRSLEQRALPELRNQLANMQAAMQNYADGDTAPLLAAAHTAQSLSRDLDGYDLNINHTGSYIREQLTYVVIAAYLVITTAGAA
jgi:hypothetical protein